MLGPGLREKFISFSLVSLWFGLVMGVIEYTYTLIYQSLGGRVHMSKDFFWMTPLADIGICIGIGLFMFVLSTAFPRLASIRILSFVFIFIILISLHFVEVKINQIAAFLLALGVSFQLSTVLNNRSYHFLKFIRATLPWMLLTFGVVFIMRLAYIL